MVNKIITSVGRYAVKKVGGKAVDKFIEKVVNLTEN